MLTVTMGRMSFVNPARCLYDSCACRTVVTVTGEFELFEENDFSYCQLKDAILNS